MVAPFSFLLLVNHGFTVVPVVYMDMYTIMCMVTVYGHYTSLLVVVCILSLYWFMVMCMVITA